MSEAKLMRTSMYAGGTSPVKMIQAGFYNEDCLVYDLEDSVSAGEKDAARFLVYNAVKYQRPKDKYILIRVNGIYSKVDNPARQLKDVHRGLSQTFGGPPQIAACMILGNEKG